MMRFDLAVFKNTIPYLTFWYRRFGKLALVGVCLLLLALILLVVNKTYQQKQLTSLELELASLDSVEKNSIEETFAAQKLAKQSSAGVDGIFELRKESDMLAILETIQTEANNHDIYVENIDYQFSTLPLLNAARYELTFPASGQYLNFRRFLKQLTEGYSGIVLQHIEFARESKQVNELDGLLKFSVYVEGSQ